MKCDGVCDKCTLEYCVSYEQRKIDGLLKDKDDAFKDASDGDPFYYSFMQGW